MRSGFRGLLCIGLLFGLALPVFGGSGTGLSNIYVIPAAGSLPGAGGTYWRLDLAIQNPYSWRSITVRMVFLQEKTDNTTPPHRDFTINPGGQLNLGDVVGTQFGITGKGALELWTQDGAYFTTNARSYTASANGTYGTAIPGQSYVVGANVRAFTSGIRVGNGYRTNIGAVNASSVAVQILAEVLDASGVARGSYTFNLLPWSNDQVAVSDFASDFGPGSVRWTCLSTASGVSWMAYATPVDNASGDGIYLEEQFDDQHTAARPAWDLGGRWSGSLSIIGAGSEQVTVDLYQDGGTVWGYVYNAVTGCREMYLYGSESQGAMTFRGTPYLLPYKDDSVSGSGNVTSGSGIVGTFTGTGLYSAGGSFAISKAYSFAPQAQPLGVGHLRGHAPLQFSTQR